MPESPVWSEVPREGWLAYIDSAMSAVTRAVLDPVMLEQLDPPGKTLLDVGCGEGYFARRLTAAGGARVVGVDVSPAFIERAREQDPDGEYAVADLGDGPPLGEGVFDAISAYMVVMYLPDLGAAYRSIAESLVPGGRFVACTANPYYAYPVGQWGPALRSGRFSPNASGHRGARIIARQVLDVLTGRFDWILYLGNYFETRTVDKPLGPMTVQHVHRPLPEHLNAAAAAGLDLVSLREPQASPEVLAAFADEPLARALGDLPLYHVLTFERRA